MQKIILQITYSFFVRWFLKLIVGVKFTNAKFLLKENQFIIVANHNSHLDTMALLASLPGKIVYKVRPVAAADYFGKTKTKEKLVNYFVNTLLIPRKRDEGDPENDPINKMIHAIDNGYSLIIFPEGTRGEPEIPQPLKPGIAYVLKNRPHIKYIPVYMTGMGTAMPKDDALIVPFESTLVYGKPVQVASTEIRDILKQIGADLNSLKEENDNRQNS
ncbi:MAG: 1-acyl-sn-glycerol-3-phosphate acyltransferase [Tannerella sp.]|jgi:1-acyl-sn-glycerol-3-phosphate acyltransferase|nr:1-acyl-sn-glycerol-3-phosphate acyltransferase [Tannerella sp.]